MANCLRFKNIQESVFRSLEHFGYGAIIEVTNGARSKKRKRQKTDILKFFKRYYRSSSKDVKIEYGLGLIESSINKLKSLNTNFRISVPYLDHIQYREAAISLVNKFYLAPVENSLLENLLISAETTGKSLKTLVKQSKKSI
ncbi:hypothetical protein KY314_01040 [Candidatus Woesearchaeota archaeon]|nr:hypothetical protein [Candidatus Woesearchaeota archaeon]